MSRIGKQPIEIPANVEVRIENNEVFVKGPKGELSEKIHKLVSVEQKDNQVLVTIADQEDKEQKSLWGLSQRLISNMVKGVVDGFSRKLEVNGVGYKVEVKGNILVLHVGYSHPVEFNIPENIEIVVEKNVITISGANKQQVGQVASEIRQVRKPEPYKGKGIKYEDEVIKRKVGKAAAKAG